MFAGHRTSEDALGAAFAGRGERVIDGDTIVVAVSSNTPLPAAARKAKAGDTTRDTPVRVRLAGIDAPEMSQPHGPQSRTHLATLIADKAIRLEYTRTGRYGRLLANV